MPSFAISQFIILLEPPWVPAEFLRLSTGPLLYIILQVLLLSIFPHKNVASKPQNVRFCPTFFGGHFILWLT